MSDDFDLKDLILSWKMEYGEDYTHESGTMKVIPANSGRRQEALSHLIKTLISEHGFKRDDFTPGVKNQIVESCINLYSKKKVKRSEWRQYASSDFDTVLIGFFKLKILEATKDEWFVEGKIAEEYIKPEIEKFGNPELLDEVRKETAPKPKNSKIIPLDFKEIRKDRENIIRDVEDDDLLKELGLKDE